MMIIWDVPTALRNHHAGRSSITTLLSVSQQSVAPGGTKVNFLKLLLPKLAIIEYITLSL